MKIRFLLASLTLSLTLLAAPALAENEGQGKLDEATALKLEAKSPADLAKVIELCETAIEEGLDEGNQSLASQILAASALQRAQMQVQMLPRVANNPNAIRKLRREMLDDLEKAVEYNPQLSEAFILMAKLETLPGGTREQAFTYLNKAIELLANKPVDQAQVYVLRAGLQEDNEDKIADLAKAIEIDGTNTDAIQAKIALQLALGKSEAVLADAVGILDKDADNMFAFEAAIRAMMELEKYDEAIELLNGQIERDDSNGVFYRLRGRMHVIKGDTEEALADLNKAIELDKRDADALVLRGQVYYSMGETEKANRDISDSLLIAPNSVQGILMRSFVAADEQRYADAIADMEMLVRADPSNVQWIMQLASFYQMDDRPRLAIRVLDELLRRDDSLWRALRLRGDAKLAIGDHTSAIEDYESAVTVMEESRELDDEAKRADDLDYSGVLNNLSWVLATSPKDEIRNGDRALELALKACEATNYEAPHILSTLAAAYAETGNFEKAREWAAKAVELAEKEENPQLEQLRGELQSYEENKPWREEQDIEENATPLGSAADTIDT